MIENFTFHCDFGSGEEQLYPVNDDLVFRDERDSTFGFLRRRLDTTLIFKGADFDRLYQIELSGTCDKYDVEIRYDTGDFYKAELKFRTSNTDWDLTLCKVQVKLEPKDEYTCLIDEWEKERNIFSIIPLNTKTVKTYQGNIEESICTENPCTLLQCTVPYDCFPGGADAGGWNYVEHQVITNIGGNYRRVTRWKREYIVVDCTGGIPNEPPGDGWILVDDNCPVSAKYARKLATTYNQANSFSIDPSGTPEEVWYSQFWDIAGLGQTEQVESISNGILLTDILSGFNPCTELTLRSNLLGINAQGADPATSPYTSNKTKNIVVFQKSDIKRYWAYQDATKGMISFKKLCEVLAGLFKIEIRIQNADLRIEHHTYFNEVNGTDLTSPTYINFIDGFSKYQYDGANSPRAERWKYYEDVSRDFEGFPVYYDCPTLADTEEKVISFERINNDIAHIILNNQDISNDGFCFVETTIIDGDYYMVSRYIYPLTSQVYINGGYAITSLIDNYHRWERPFLTGTLNGTVEAFDSAIRRRKQVELNVKINAQGYKNFNAEELVKSQLGWGKVESIAWSAKSCKLTLTLLH